MGDGYLAVIGLGANLGDTTTTIEAAMEAIGELPGVTLVRRSSLWRTDPVGGPPQPSYCNAALAVHTGLSPIQLMRELLGIEGRFGRTRGARNAPRTLDLDLLWIDGEAIRSSDVAGPTLEVPHPRLAERAFALVPLLEVAPDARDPATGKRYADVLAELGREGVLPLDSSGA